MGRSSETSKTVNSAVLPSGPGASMIVKEKIPTISSSRYWKSYKVHRCLWSDLKVSAGEKDVCSEAMEDEGDIRLRNFDRSRRRTR